MALSTSFCPNCNANVTAASAKFCAFCGTALPRPDAPAPLVGEERTAARFQALGEHPRLARLMDRTPSSAALAEPNENTAGGGVMLAIIGGFLVLTGAEKSSYLLAFGVILVVVGLIIAISSVHSTAELEAAPLRRLLGRVADERVEVSGGGEHAQARSTYYVTVESASGARTEYRSTKRVAGKVAPDDIGVAYVKKHVLLDFQRVRV